MPVANACGVSWKNKWHGRLARVLGRRQRASRTCHEQITQACFEFCVFIIWTCFSSRLSLRAEGGFRHSEFEFRLILLPVRREEMVLEIPAERRQWRRYEPAGLGRA